MDCGWGDGWGWDGCGWEELGDTAGMESWRLAGTYWKAWLPAFAACALQNAPASMQWCVLQAPFLACHAWQIQHVYAAAALPTLGHLLQRRC